MGIKRKSEENNNEHEKKSKIDEVFPMEMFIKNLKDPESSFLALSEFNEYTRHVTSNEKLDELIDDLLQHLKSNLDDVLVLITEEKRKSSENITLYRFLTTLLEYLSRKQMSSLSEMITKKFVSITNSIHTIYFMLSSHSTASHLKVTLRFLMSIVQQDEYNCRLIFSSIDFKRPCWKLLLKRRDIRDTEDVRYWFIKFFLSPLVYQHIDTIRHLIKEQDIFYEIFNGLINDSRHTIEFVLDEIRTNIIMLPGITKTDKINLCNDRNLKSLIRLYNWTGQQKQKDMKKSKKKKNHFDEAVEFENVDIQDNEQRDEIRRIIHTFLMIVLNSKNYGINFFDANFGITSKNSNPIILKLITHLASSTLNDEYITNLIVTCLTTCPDLLQPFFKLISNEYISIRSKNLSILLEFLCEIIQQQKPLNTWCHLFQTINDSTKLTDILINLTLPIDIMNKFENLILKQTDSTVQYQAMKYLSIVLERIKSAIDIITNLPLACDKMTTLESFQQAILRYIPKPDNCCEILKQNQSTTDSNKIIGQYISFLKSYSSSCFMSISSMNINLDIQLTNSILNLFVYFKENQDETLIENYFECIKNILYYRQSIDDVIWARNNKELECTPIRMLLKLSKQMKNIYQISEQLSLIFIKICSMISHSYQELMIWFYTWFKLNNNEIIEQFLSNTIEKLILNPYPLQEKAIHDTGYSLMIYSVFDAIQHSKQEISSFIDEYLCHVIFQLSIEQINPSINQIYNHLQTIYLNNRKTLKIYQLFDILSSQKRENHILNSIINSIEKLFLTNIDLTNGPDKRQIDLAIKLNIFKLFMLKETDQTRLINEMIQCFNIVLLLNDSNRSFEEIFDKLLEYIQSYSLIIDNNQIISVICQIINGLDKLHQKQSSLKHSKILLKCLNYEQTNFNIILFTSNYLSSEYRIEYLNLICQINEINLEILKIILNEIERNKNLDNEKYLDIIIDCLHGYDECIEKMLEIILELINRMKIKSNKHWKYTLRLKQKLIFKLINQEYFKLENKQILIGKLIVQTINAIRSNDRTNVLNRLLNKTNSSLILLAYIFKELVNDQQIFDNDLFFEFSRKLIENYSHENIVFDLLNLYCQYNTDHHEQISKLLENNIEYNEDLPIKQTNQLLLMIKLFPNSTETAERFYKLIFDKILKYFQSIEQENRNIDDWLNTFQQCTVHLQSQIKTNIDLYDLINELLKYFSKFTFNSMNILRTLIDIFVSNDSFDPQLLSKLFAKFLKHPNFLEQLSSEHRWIFLDVLSVFISHYNPIVSTIKIDCSKHFPMLLSIYNATLSKNDQHTLTCLYSYEKCGYKMKSTFIWGETALKLSSVTQDAKMILLQSSKLEQILNLLDENRMKKSILYYPVTRRLRTIEPQIYEEADQIYDPAYLIPAFYHSLGSESVVKCQQFIEKHCLSYCMMALSTRCGLLRAIVYNCLARFEQHLISQRFYCKEQILTMLNLLKQSIKKENLKLAPIVALFLSKLVDLFTHPESKIYRTVTRFLLKQPYIDLIHIPLFNELFHSSSAEYKYERGWILNLLKHGIKDTIDYTICTKSYVFKTLMAYYDCSLCDEPTKIEILKVFYSISKLQGIFKDLLFDYGFLLWLQIVIKNCVGSNEMLSILSMIIENIGSQTILMNNEVQLCEFNCILILFIRRLKMESIISSTIADAVLSTLSKHHWKNSWDTNEIKHIVEFSTIDKNSSLLSCFC